MINLTAGYNDYRYYYFVWFNGQYVVKTIK